MRILVRIAVAVVIGAIAAWMTYRHIPPQPLELSPAEFLAEVRQGHVREVLVNGTILLGTSSTRGRFQTTFDSKDTKLAGELHDHGVQVSFEHDSVGF